MTITVPASDTLEILTPVIDSPEHMVAEIIGGELRLSNRPAGPATATASVLGHELGPPFMHGRGGPWKLVDPL